MHHYNYFDSELQKYRLVQWIVLLLANDHGRYEPEPLQAKWVAF